MKRFFVLALSLLLCMACLAGCGAPENAGDDDETARNSEIRTDPVQDEVADEPTSEGESDEGTGTPEVPTRPNFQMSDKVEDFTVTINGLVYQLSCDVELVLDDGWVPKPGYVLEDDYSVPSGETRTVIVYSEDKNNMVSVKSYYPAEGESAYRDGIVIGFNSEEGSVAEVMMAGGLTLDENTTLQDVIDVFGEDYTYTTDYDGDRYVYSYDGKGVYIFVFLEGRLNYWELRLYREEL